MLAIAGVRFDAHALGIYYQFIDPPLLESRLLESLFYSHGQPPLFNLFLGLVLKILTFPLTIVTFGLFLLVVNALMLKFAATLVPGFEVSSFGAAFMGAFLIFILNMLWRWAFQSA